MGLPPPVTPLVGSKDVQVSAHGFDRCYEQRPACLSVPPSPVPLHPDPSPSSKKEGVRVGRQAGVGKGSVCKITAKVGTRELFQLSTPLQVCRAQEEGENMQW